jgi:tRNA pseudouridine38-40 synthase
VNLQGLEAGLRGEFPPHDAPFLPEDEPAADGRRSLALVLAYDGTRFAGWQWQTNRRTVQGVVEARLSRLCHQPVRLEASGRTDAGVHAWGQVAGFTTSSSLEIGRMLRGLRALLPPDVHPRRLGPTPPDFHARYSARAKTYDYFIWPRARAPLFMRQRLWPLDQALDAGAVSAALAQVRGEHDLRAFACRGGEVKGSTVRRILEASLTAPEQGPWRVRLTGTGFLRHAVRNLVGACVQAGMGRLPPEAVGEMLAAGRRLYSGPKAPAAGLYLNRVYYQNPPA